MKGNPSKTVNVGISVSVDGWYPGKTGTGNEKASSDMTISSDTVPKDPAQTFISSSGNNAVNVKFDNGLEPNEVLVGYSEISWSVENGYTPPAGDYSATVTITITSDGVSQAGGESA